MASDNMSEYNRYLAWHMFYFFVSFLHIHLIKVQVISVLSSGVVLSTAGHHDSDGVYKAWKARLT